MPTGDNLLPTTQPKRPTPPKVPPQPSVNNDKDNDTSTETSVIQDSVSEVKDGNKKSPPKIPPQPVAPPRKKRQQKKVKIAF